MVIVGMALEAPGGIDDAAGFWSLLSERREALGPFPTDRGWALQDLFAGSRRDGYKVIHDLGGFLTGAITSAADLPADDFRAGNPRFAEENLARNLALVDEVRAVAAEAAATPAQVALAWLLAQGDDIAVIPGTKRVSRLEENAAADALVLTGDQLARLTALAPAAGERYAPEGMSRLGL